MRWPESWRRRRRAPAASTAPPVRAACAMLALADGEPGASSCAVPTCRSFGHCPTMTELQELAGHLRRVRAQVQHERSQPSMTGRHVRLTAGRLAYSDLLVQVCAKLHIATELPRCSGVARDVEILRVEAALARYGLSP